MKIDYKKTVYACFVGYVVQAVSQWASAFAEAGLGISKTAGIVKK